MAQLLDNVKKLLADLSASIGQPTETAQRDDVLGLCGLFCFHQFLYAQAKGIDKKLYAQVWSLCKRVPLVYLGGVAMWRPLDFLSRTLPLKSSSMHADAAAKLELDSLKQLDAELPRDVASLRLSLCKWLARFDSDLTDHPRKGEVLGASTSLLIQGILLGCRLAQLLRSALGGHFELRQPLPKTALPPLLGIVELIKALQTAVDRRAGLLAVTAMHATRAICLQLCKLLLPLKLKLEAARRLDDTALDRLAAVTLMLHTLSGPPSRLRLTILELARHVAQLKGTLKEQEHDEMCDLLWKLHTLAQWQTTLAAATDCSLLFFARELLPPLVGLAQELPNPRLLRTLLDATRDCEPTLRRVTALGIEPSPAAIAAAAEGDGVDTGGDGGGGGGGGGSWLGILRAMQRVAVDEQLLRKLNLAVETDLRFAQHAASTSAAPAGTAPTGTPTGNSPATVRTLAQRLCQPPLMLGEVTVRAPRRLRRPLPRLHLLQSNHGGAARLAHLCRDAGDRHAAVRCGAALRARVRGAAAARRGLPARADDGGGTRRAADHAQHPHLR